MGGILLLSDAALWSLLQFLERNVAFLSVFRGSGQIWCFCLLIVWMLLGMNWSMSEQREQFSASHQHAKAVVDWRGNYLRRHVNIWKPRQREAAAMLIRGVSRRSRVSGSNKPQNTDCIKADFDIMAAVTMGQRGTLYCLIRHNIESTDMANVCKGYTLRNRSQ